MSKQFKFWALLPALSLFVLAGCEDLKEEITTPDDTQSVTVGIKAGVSFSLEGKADLTLTLSEKSEKDVTVTLATSDKAQEGYTAVPADALTFDSSVTIEAGKTSASITVTAVLDNLSTLNQAVIAIASADGAEIDAKASVVYIAVPDTGGDETSGDLGWKIAYMGCDFVEGLYHYGQLDQFEVSGTNGQYYYALLQNVKDGSFSDALAKDSEAFLSDLQDLIDYELDEEMEYYDETLEEAMGYIFYNEKSDGTEVYLRAVAAGDSEFAVFTVDGNGQLDGRWQILSFSKDSDPVSIYDWGLNLSLNPDYYAQWYGWVSGYEGQYYSITGNAPGADYVAVASYTDEELNEAWGGDINAMYNYMQSYVKDLVAAGYDLETLAYYGMLAEVDESGYFEAGLANEEDFLGSTKVYIYAFDANGKMLNDYGVSEIEIVEEEKIEWTERTDWAANYDASVDTGDPSYPMAIVVTECDAKYFSVFDFVGGQLEYWGINNLALYADLSWDMDYYECDMDGLVELGIVGTCDKLPYVSAHSEYIENGDDIIIFGYDENGNLTGEYHFETLTGIVEGGGDEPGGGDGGDDEPLEMQLVEEWSVTPDFDTFESDYWGDCSVEIEVNAPGIKWYFVTEATQDNLDTVYDGSLANLAKDREAECEYWLKWDDMDDILASEEYPQEELYVSNAGKETTIYIFEYNEDGKATGRYGATTVTMPEAPEGDDDWGYLAPARNLRKSAALKHFKHPRKQVAGKQQTVTVNNNAPKFDLAKTMLGGKAVAPRLKK